MDMPPFNTRQPADEPSTKQWFDSIEAETPLPATGMPGSSSSPNGRRRVLFVAMVIAVLLIAIFVAVTVIGRLPNTLTCLNKQDYAQLTGQTADPQLTPQAFYTSSFDFTNQSIDFSATSKSDAETQAKKIGQFYVTHATDRSIVVTVSGDAFDNDTIKAASGRITLLKNLLISNGVASSAIKTVAPNSVSNDGEVSADSPDLTGAKTYISIASAASCRQ
jgi:hypothetical protein